MYFYFSVIIPAIITIPTIPTISARQFPQSAQHKNMLQPQNAVLLLGLLNL